MGFTRADHPSPRATVRALRYGPVPPFSLHLLSPSLSYQVPVSSSSSGVALHRPFFWLQWKKPQSFLNCHQYSAPGTVQINPSAHSPSLRRPKIPATPSSLIMFPSIRSVALAGFAASLLPQALAQTSTSCNPLNATCPADAALGTNATFLFNETSANSKLWNTTAGTIDYNSTGGQFTISEKGVSPTLISNFFIFFGRVDVVLKAASGQGIVSSIVLESDDLDEVDFEWIGGNNTSWQSNVSTKQSISQR